MSVSGQGCDALVPAEAPLAGDSKDGKQSQGLPLLGRAGPRNAVDVDRGSAERLEVEHLAPSDRALTGRLPSVSKLAPIPW